MKRFLFVAAMLCMAVIGAKADDTEGVWTLVGDAAIANGVSWDPTATVNDMSVKTRADGVFECQIWVMNCSLSVGNYYFKFVHDHSWSGSQIPRNRTDYAGNEKVVNESCPIEEEGLYDLLFDFQLESDGTTPATWSVTLCNKRPLPHEYSVVGDYKDFLGGTQAWDWTNTETDMGAEGDGWYHWYKTDYMSPAEDVAKTSLGVYYKICVDHTENNYKGDSEGNNMWLSTPLPSRYSVTVKYNENTDEIIGTAYPTAILNNHGWGTYSCNQDVSVKTLGIMIFKAKKEVRSGGNYLVLTEIDGRDGYIPAGTGVLVFGGEANANAEVEFMTGRGDAADVSDNVFSPTITTTAGITSLAPLPTSGITYVIGANDKSVMSQYTSDTFKAFRAYYLLSDGSNAKEMKIVFDTDGIENISNTDQFATQTYNLAGLRVSADAKGLVIMNGKKIFNK